MKGIHVTAFILVIIGALNWGLIGLGAWFGGNWNVIDHIFGSMSWLEALIYVLVGISALVLIFTHGKTCGACQKKGMNTPTSGTGTPAM